MVTILNLMMLINSNGSRRRFSSDCCCSCKILLVFTSNVKETKGKWVNISAFTKRITIKNHLINSFHGGRGVDDFFSTLIYHSEFKCSSISQFDSYSACSNVLNGKRAVKMNVVSHQQPKIILLTPLNGTRTV